MQKFISTAVFFTLAPLTIACTGNPEPSSIPPTDPVVREPTPEPAADVELPVGPGPSPTDIQLAVGQRQNELRQCYIAGTFKDAQLKGTVTVTFVIDTDGDVVEAKDGGSDMPDPEVVDCVLGVFADLEFNPGGQNSTEVTYPVRFGERG